MKDERKRDGIEKMGGKKAKRCRRNTGRVTNEKR